MALADQANRYIDEHKPWVLIKDESKLDNVHAVCTQGINLFRSLMIYLAPVIPNCGGWRHANSWAKPEWHCGSDASTAAARITTINKFRPLLDDESNPNRFRRHGRTVQRDRSETHPRNRTNQPTARPSRIDDFMKVDLRSCAHRVGRAGGRRRQAVRNSSSTSATRQTQLCSPVSRPPMTPERAGRDGTGGRRREPRAAQDALSVCLGRHGSGSRAPAAKTFSCCRPMSGARPGMRVK